VRARLFSSPSRSGIVALIDIAACAEVVNAVLTVAAPSFFGQPISKEGASIISVVASQNPTLAL